MLGAVTGSCPQARCGVPSMEADAHDGSRARATLTGRTACVNASSEVAAFLLNLNFFCIETRSIRSLRYFQIKYINHVGMLCRQPLVLTEHVAAASHLVLSRTRASLR